MHASAARNVLSQIEDMLKDVKATAQSDPEHAHGTRDAIYLKALESLAAYHWDRQTMRQVAAAAVKASKIKLKWEASA